MLRPKIITFSATYRRGSGLDVINLAEIPISFVIEERSMVRISPGQIGGNHKHPRTEAFFVVAGKGMKFIWQDENGNNHAEEMMGEVLKLFIIPPYLPHTVKNESNEELGILIEYADGPQKDVETINIA